MRVWWRQWRCAALLLVAMAVVAIRIPRTATLISSLPHHEPAALAHYLADFSHHTLLDEDIGEWSVEKEAGNASWWQYSVNFACGSRCVGHAAITHAQPSALFRTHVAAVGDKHRLHLRDTRCAPLLPLLPWPSLCEELDTEMVIESGADGGTVVEERVTRWAALSAHGWAQPVPRFAHLAGGLNVT